MRSVFFVSAISVIGMLVSLLPAVEANAPKPASAPTLATEAAELIGKGFSIRVPAADWQAKDGDVLLPAPIMAVRVANGPWLGCGYLETAAQALSLKVERSPESAKLDYQFAGGGRWQVTVKIVGSIVTIDEVANMGPRDAWVFDTFYNWNAEAGIALAPKGAFANFLYVPCHFDRVEATILAHTPGPQTPAGLAVLADSTQRREMIALWAREVPQWKNPEQLPVQLWQRRQRGNDVRSRHFVGPDTKSDGTPNPRTAALLGTSLYEGHVTLECLLGQGERRLALAILPQPDDRAAIVPAIARLMESAQ